MYFAHCSEFNDPLEGRFFSEEHDAKKHFNEFNLGFFSMSENWKSYPMWAHYANQHKGCCLMFKFSHLLEPGANWEKSFPFIFTEMVNYIKEPLGYKDAVKYLPHEYESIYMSKLEKWTYEEEWRAVMYAGDYEHYETKKSMFKEGIVDSVEFCKMKRARHKDKTEERNLYPLSENLLDGIILGYNMTDTEKKTVFYVAKECKANVYEAQLIKYNFDMELRQFKV